MRLNPHNDIMRALSNGIVSRENEQQNIKFCLLSYLQKSIGGEKKRKTLLFLMFSCAFYHIENKSFVGFILSKSLYTKKLWRVIKVG